MICSLLRIIQLYVATTAVFSTKLMIYTDKTRTPVALSHTISYPLLNLNHNYVILYKPYYSICFTKHRQTPSQILFYISDGMKRKPHGLRNVKLHQVYLKKNRNHVHYVPIYVPINSNRDSKIRLNYTRPSVTPPPPPIRSSLRPTLTPTQSPTQSPSQTPTQTLTPTTSQTPTLTPTNPSIRPTPTPTPTPTSITPLTTIKPSINPTVSPTPFTDYKITDTYLSCVKSPRHLYKSTWNTATYIDKEMNLDMPIIYQCSMECNKKHYIYYGIDSGTQCWCAMTEPDSRKLRYNMCLPCQDYSSTTCGNVNYGLMSIYKIN